MPTLFARRGLLLQASLLLALLAAGPSSGGGGLVEARRRSKRAAPEPAAEDKKATEQFDELPPPSPPQWKGKIGMRTNESTPFWPKQMAAPEGAPNVLMILIDDAGFGATSAFGGPIPTPTFEKLAARGLRYTAFHTTALCSPTRAALLTGRNHHSVHTGTITETASGFPGYDTLMQKDTASVGEIMKQRGWNTFWCGKNHNVPDWQSSSSGPFDLWPNNLGFEHFYGFIGGDTSQWRPALYEGNKPIEPYLDDPDYHLNKDLANQIIKYVEHHTALTPDKPWFTYYSPGATHAPHHVGKEWIDQFKGKFDHGWDKQRELTFQKQKEMGIFPADANLTARPKEIPAWDETPEGERAAYARFMETYAGFMAQTDYEIGRVLDRIKELGQEDNTLVILMIGDNGASGEGSLKGLANEMCFFNNIPEDTPALNIDDIGSQATYNHYPVGWAHAMNTPFQWNKQIASHYGGVRNPMIISWPKRIKENVHGQFRTQWHHVIDVAPTILEAVDVKPPSKVNGVDQKPIEGVSMVYTFDDADADSKRETQYFEMLGNQGIYSKGWTAGTTPMVLPWVGAEVDVDPIDGYEWELYNVKDDPTQSKNLAKDNPGKLKEMRQLFNQEAEKYNVFPIDNSRTKRLDVSNRPSLMRGRRSITFFQGMIRTPEGAAPDFKNKDYNLTADVNLPTGAENGVLATIGGRYSGWSWYLKDGFMKFYYNLAGVKGFEVKSDAPVPAGDHKLGFKFDYDGNGMGKGGLATLFVDGNQVGQGRIDETLCCRISLDETFDVGADTGTSANPADYDVPNAFKGVMKGLTIEI